MNEEPQVCQHNDKYEGGTGYHPEERDSAAGFEAYGGAQQAFRFLPYYFVYRSYFVQGQEEQDYGKNTPVQAIPVVALSLGYRDYGEEKRTEQKQDRLKPRRNAPFITNIEQAQWLESLRFSPMYRANLAARPARVIISTAIIMTRTIVLA